MKKIIATKQIKRWQKIDRLVLAVPLVILLLLSLGNQGRLIWGAVFREKNFALTAAALFLLALAAIIASFPVILIARAISHTVKKAAIQNATFRTDEDFDYYREKLTGIPPATISLLMDLKIETKKDIAALLLRYVKLGAVSLEGGTVRVINQQLPGLLPSDLTLLTLLAQGTVQPASLGPWKRQVMEEAVQSGALKSRGSLQNIQSVSRSCLTGCLSGCLLPFLLFLGLGLGAGAILESGWLNESEAFFAAAPRDFGMEQLNYFLSSPDIVPRLALAALLTLLLFSLVLLPVAAALRTATAIFASNASLRLKRTETGELLTAQISGLKNFIRDFSNLSQVEKEQLLLWDDFLIYAVVLEENERIIEDIFSMKNLRYQDYTLF